MASVKIKFSEPTRPNSYGRLYFRVIHGRMCRQIPSGARIYPDEWDSINGNIISQSPDPEREDMLVELRLLVEREKIKLAKIISFLDSRGREYDISRIVEMFRRPMTGFLEYSFSLIERLVRIGKTSTARTYSIVVKKYRLFLNGDDVPMQEIDSDMMVHFESHMKKQGMCANSTSYYLRNMRAIYNRAVDEGQVEQALPFRHVYTGIAKTVKRAIPVKQIKHMRQLDLSFDKDLEYARDMFILSFFLRGMSVVDMAFLKKTDLCDGYVIYRRQKTGQELRIKWVAPMQEIIDRYPGYNPDYLLPIIKEGSVDFKKAYRTRAHFINTKLKKIGKMVGCKIPLSLYVARHSWASVAKSSGVPLSVISEGMGHDSEKTTMIYLASLDTTAVDRANTKIINKLI